jgi:hypothetical protein
VTGLVQRIDSAHSMWLFDSERQRFRRLPLDADPDAPALDSDWEPYFALEVDEATGAFTVALNEDGTRLLRAFRAPVVDAPTQELRLPPTDGDH